MTKPVPAPLDPSQILERALRVIEADRFPYLATMDGDQPRVRPVSPVRTDRFTVYVANLRSYHKTGEIAANLMARGSGQLRSMNGMTISKTTQSQAMAISTGWRASVAARNRC